MATVSAILTLELKFDLGGRPRRGQITNRHDQAVADAEVGVEARVAGAVENGAVPDDGVEGRRRGLSMACGGTNQAGNGDS